MRTVLVGIAPRRPEDQGRPLEPIRPSSTGSRICRLLDVTPCRYLGGFDRVNLLPTWRKGGLKNPSWYSVYAENLTSVLRGRHVIFFGADVTRAFIGKRDYTWGSWSFTWNDVPFDYCPLPHPSGLNRWYNDEKNQRLAIYILSQELARFEASAAAGDATTCRRLGCEICG